MKGKRGNRKPLQGPDDPRHGTVNAYNNLGCRCDPCRGALASRMFVYRADHQDYYERGLAAERNRRALLAKEKA